MTFKLTPQEKDKVRNDPKLQKFFRKKNPSPSTKKTYHYTFENFYKATGLTLSDAIEKARKEEEKGLPLPDRKIDDHFGDFRDFMLEKDSSAATIKKGFTQIRALYRKNGIILPDNDWDIPDNNKTLTTEDLPGIEEIKTAMEESSPLFKAIIILMASSGMGRAEILSLTIQDLLDAINSKNKHVQIVANDLTDIPQLKKKLGDQVMPLQWCIERIKMRYKKREPYITFSTPESLDYILRYFKLTRNRKVPKPEPEQKLFYSYRAKPLADNGFLSYFGKLNERCGWKKKNRQAYFRSHHLRKWFANQLIKTSMGYIDTNRLLGHQALNKSDASYFLSDPDELYRKYLENMDSLTIYSKVQTYDNTDERVQELEELRKQDQLEIKQLRQIIERELLHKQNPPKDIKE